MEMHSLYRLVLLYSVIAVSSALSLKKKEIDWETKTIREYSRFEFYYGAHKPAEMVRLLYAESFVQIMPNSILQSDFEGLAKHFEARSKLGHWEAGTPHVVHACDNIAFVWAQEHFIDGANITQNGYAAFVLELVDDEAKVKMIQLTV